MYTERIVTSSAATCTQDCEKRCNPCHDHQVVLVWQEGHPFPLEPRHPILLPLASLEKLLHEGTEKGRFYAYATASDLWIGYHNSASGEEADAFETESECVTFLNS